MKNGKRVVLVATDLSTGGGVNKVVRDVSTLLAERLGLDVTVVNARSDRAPTYTFSRTVQVQHKESGGLLAYLGVLWAIRRSRPDFVVGSWTQDNILLVLVFLFSSTRVILCEHTSWYFHARWVRAMRRLVYPLAWRLLVLNPAELSHYAAYLRNVRLLPNPVPELEAPPEQTREKLIVAVGHLEPRKNFGDAIAAMAQSGLEREGWSLAIIGAGPEEEKLRMQIGELGLTRTHIHPPTGDLGTWYARASLTMVTAKLEVFSLVLAEAMLSGVVPVAYATDGPSFILEDHPNLLVPIGAAGALASRMAELAAEDLAATRQQMRSVILARFGESVIAERWAALLDEA